MPGHHAHIPILLIPLRMGIIFIFLILVVHQDIAIVGLAIPFAALVPSERERWRVKGFTSHEKLKER